MFFIMAFILPGFICVKFYEILTGQKRTDASQFRMDFFAYSLINNFFALLLDITINHFLASKTDIVSYLLYFLYFVILPICLTYILYLSRKANWSIWLFQHPDAYAWDHAFKNAKNGCFVIVTLNDGKKYAGKYISKPQEKKTSFAASGYLAKDIYLAEQWELNKNASFKKKTNQTGGIYLSDIKTIEFFE
ncbi:MAG: DUF6338 family protein [Hydrotalea sp.]|nr:DUF6338 family protein [Hydrotalea sp.]